MILVDSVGEFSYFLLNLPERMTHNNYTFFYFFQKILAVATRGIPNGTRDVMIGNSRERGWIYTCVLDEASAEPLAANDTAYQVLCQKIDNEWIPTADVLSDE